MQRSFDEGLPSHGTSSRRHRFFYQIRNAYPLDEMMSMEPTHYMYLAVPPRKTFVFDATPAEQDILAQHFAYMEELARRGTLVLTGPSLDGEFGVAIFEATQHDQAQAIVGEDPAIIAGMFTARLHPLKIGFLRGQSGPVEA
jgi:uncharacterized protein YciI